MKSILPLILLLFLWGGCHKEDPPVVSAIRDAPPPSMEEGLLAWWPFDEGTGNIADDLSGNNLRGELSGGVWHVRRPGHALWFDGYDDVVTVSTIDPGILNTADEGTICLWFRFEDSVGNGNKPIQPMLYLGKPDAAGKDECFVLEVGHVDPPNSGIYFTWVYNGIPKLCFNSQEQLVPGKWYHFAGMVGNSVNTSGEKSTGYLNGKEMIDRYYSYGDRYTPMFFNEFPDDELENIWIGNGKTSDYQTPDFHFYSGTLDDIRIYDRVLTPDEVNALFHRAGVPVSSGPPVGWPGGIPLLKEEFPSTSE